MKQAPWAYFAPSDEARLEDALHAWQSERPQSGLLAFCSEHSIGMVAPLQRLANRLAMPLAGGIAPGLIVAGELMREGLVLAALDAAIPQAIVPLPRDGGATADSAVAELADFAEKHAGGGEDTLLLFFDALTPDIASLLDRLYLLLGNRVRYAGSNLGSESFRAGPCVFDNTRFVDGAVLALLLPDHPGAALAHRYCKTTPLRTATSVSGNRIDFIDGRPAFEVYRELVAEHHGVVLDRENFYRHAVHFPLALHLAEGEPLVRIAVAVSDAGNLVCIGEIPEAALLSVVEAASPDSRETADEVATRLRASAPRSALVFYCAGRLLHHGTAGAMGELRALQQAIAPATLFGALSLGEIGNYRAQGYPRFHNAAIAALPWY